ncbi:hypothetical protein HSE3_gp025 [Bacillus phage vB_BceM-HSE3]|nr:hypothetical protein HSE3_gp025 [Bacillus phage vB_BceM-HSE3]
MNLNRLAGHWFLISPREYNHPRKVYVDRVSKDQVYYQYIDRPPDNKFYNLDISTFRTLILKKL